MTTAREKDIVLKLIYNDHINVSFDYNSPCSDYESLYEKSGLEEHVFSLAFDELLRHRLIHSYGPQGDIIPIIIEREGKYFYEQGGFTAKERKRKRRAKWKRMGDWVHKFGPIAVPLFAASWSVAVYFMQRQSDETIKEQRASIDSLTKAVHGLTIQEKKSK